MCLKLRYIPEHIHDFAYANIDFDYTFNFLFCLTILANTFASGCTIAIGC